MVPLSKSPIGAEKTVTWITGTRTQADTIRSLGISEGSAVTVTGSFFDSVIVAVDRFRYALDSDLAFCIKVC